MTPLFSDEPGWESGREVQGRIAARLGRVAEEERKQQRAKRAAICRTCALFGIDIEALLDDLIRDFRRR